MSSDVTSDNLAHVVGILFKMAKIVTSPSVALLKLNILCQPTEMLQGARILTAMRRGKPSDRGPFSAKKQMTLPSTDPKAVLRPAQPHTQGKCASVAGV